MALAVALAGCGDDEEEEKPATCETNCERIAAANCAATAPDDVTTCKQSCATNSQTVAAACRDEVAAVFACFGTQYNYACNASGSVYVTNPEACAAPALACVNCGAGPSCLGL